MVECSTVDEEGRRMGRVESRAQRRKEPPYPGRGQGVIPLVPVWVRGHKLFKPGLVVVVGKRVEGWREETLR